MGKGQNTTSQREALEFFNSHREAMMRRVPRGKEAEYGATFCWIREPAYCWKSSYGDFSPATLHAATAAGLLEKDGYRPGWRITAAGRAALEDGRDG